MWPLALCALVAAGIIAWKLIELSVRLGRAHALLERADALVARRMIAEAHALARASATPAGRVLDAGLARRESGPAAVRMAIDTAQLVERAHLQRGLVVLAAIATIAPLVGGLTTVLDALERMRSADAFGDALPGILLPLALGVLLAVAVALLQLWLSGRIDEFSRAVRESAQVAARALDSLDAGRAP